MIPKVPSKPETSLRMVQPTACALPKMTSTSSPSGYIALSPLSLTASSSSSNTSTPSSSDDEADSPHSAHFSQSTRKLCPRLLITYNETVLMKIHGRLQIWMLNSISLPLLLNNSDEEESPMASESDYTAEESPTSYKPNDEESPMFPSNIDTQEGSSVTSSSIANDKEESSVTKNTNDQHKIEDFSIYKDTLSQN